MGLCDVVSRKFGLCVMAKFRKFRGTRDSGWLFGRGGNCGAVGVMSTLLCSSSYVFCRVAIFVLYSFICASKKNFVYRCRKRFQKILQRVCVLRLLVCLLVCV